MSLSVDSVHGVTAGESDRQTDSEKLKAKIKPSLLIKLFDKPQ